MAPDAPFFDIFCEVMATCFSLFSRGTRVTAPCTGRRSWPPPLQLTGPHVSR